MGASSILDHWEGVREAADLPVSYDCSIPLFTSLGRAPATALLGCSCACPARRQMVGQHQHKGQGSCLLSVCSCFPGSSFSDLGSAKLGQRPLSQPAGISTNPFMVSARVHHGAPWSPRSGAWRQNPCRKTGRCGVEFRPLPHEVLPCPSQGRVG